MRILLTGLSGTGKTYLADKLSSALHIPILNGDDVRSASNDWDFTYEGRHRQALRMYEMSQDCDNIIFDFIAPLPLFRDIVRPDFIIWMNTKTSSQYPDTDSLYQPPKYPNIILHTFNYKLDSVIEVLKDCLP
jgi:adenylylsulfate kinase